MKPIAIQLYSLRELAKEDMVGTLKKVADIGFKGVEFAGLYDNDPKELASVVKDLGMQVCSSHVAMPNKENINKFIDTELTLGNNRVISGYGPDDLKTMDACKAAAADFQNAVSMLKSSNISVGYHNHWWEFEQIDGKLVYDILLQEAPDVFSELDIYWVTYAKYNAVDIVSKNKARIPLLHIKDGSLEKDAPHLPAGSGKVNIPPIISAADPNVLEWVIVELDLCATDMLEAVRSSYNYLTSNSLAIGNK